MTCINTGLSVSPKHSNGIVQFSINNTVALPIVICWNYGQCMEGHDDNIDPMLRDGKYRIVRHFNTLHVT